MSLATRCAQCGTVFRVVEDQLKVSEGWVRCGRCEAVFNALETLFDLDQEAPPPWPGAEDPAQPPVPPPPAPAPSWRDELPPPSRSPNAPLEPPPFEPSELPDDDVVSARLEHRPLLHEPDDDGPRADPRFEPTHPPQDPFDEPADPPLYGRPASLPMPMRESAPETAPAPAPAAPRRVAATVPPAEAPPPAPAPATTAPDFVRRADRAAVWHRPGLRALLVVLALLLALLLAAQVALRWRDTLAVRWPESAPVLHALCKAAGCAVEPLRRVDSLAVDSSGLVKLEGTGNHYQFNVALRNHDRVAVMLPSMELTLTDAQGQVVARKVMAAAEMGSDAATIAAGATLALHGVLAAGERKLTGYTVEIFYP